MLLCKIEFCTVKKPLPFLQRGQSGGLPACTDLHTRKEGKIQESPLMGPYKWQQSPALPCRTLQPAQSWSALQGLVVTTITGAPSLFMSRKGVEMAPFSVGSRLPHTGVTSSPHWADHTLLNVASESEFSWFRPSKMLWFLNIVNSFYNFKGQPEIVWGPLSIFHLKHGDTVRILSSK